FYLATTVFGRRVNQMLIRALGLVIMTVTTSSLLAIGLPRMVGGLADRPEGAGGLLAGFLSAQLIDRFNVPGTLVILAVAFWIGAILTADQIVLAVPKAIGEAVLRVLDLKLPKLAIPGMGALGALKLSWSHGSAGGAVAEPP